MCILGRAQRLVKLKKEEVLIMKFEKQRSLKHNIFSTTIVRVEEDDQDCMLKEEQLEDDFGCVEVEVGGIFEAKIGIGTDGSLEVTPVTSKLPTRESESANFKFNLPSQKVKLIMDVKIPFSCDATKETSREFLKVVIPSLKIAEYKCRIFEEIILDRIELAIEAWKKKQTNFEEEILEAVHFSQDK